MNQTEAIKMARALEMLSLDMDEAIGFIGVAARTNKDVMLLEKLEKLEKLLSIVSRRVASGRRDSELHRMRDGVLERVY